MLGPAHCSEPEKQEIGGRAWNYLPVDAHERLVQRVAHEQDDLLGTLQLVKGDDLLEARLFDQLVDLLIEGLFLDLRERYLAREIAREGYVVELAQLAELCRGAGLLPLASRNG